MREEDKKLILLQEKIDDIEKFIEDNFIDNDNNKSQLENYKKLLDYLIDKKYCIDEVAAELLLSKSIKLKSMLKRVFELVNGSNIEIVAPLFKTYDRYYAVKKSKSGKDLDLIKLYLEEIKDFSVLSAKEERKLFELYHQGDQNAYEKLVNHNLKLAVNACRYFRSYNVEMGDLIQYANIALIKAINNFDETLGYKFSTFYMSYATKLIRVEIYNNRKIRLPLSVCDRVFKISKCINDERAKGNDIEDDYEELSRLTGFTVMEVIELKKYMQDAISYNVKASDDSDECIIDFIEDRDYNLEDYVVMKSMYEGVRNFIKENSKLTPREKEIIRLRYYKGISGTNIAKAYKKKKQQISAEEKRAFQKLKRDREFLRLVPDEYKLIRGR